MAKWRNALRKVEQLYLNGVYLRVVCFSVITFLFFFFLLANQRDLGCRSWCVVVFIVLASYYACIRVRSCRRCFTTIPRYLAPSPLTSLHGCQNKPCFERECSYRKMFYCDTSRSTWRFCAMPEEKQKSLFFLAVDIEVTMWTRLWLG